MVRRGPNPKAIAGVTRNSPAGQGTIGQILDTDRHQRPVFVSESRQEKLMPENRGEQTAPSGEAAGQRTPQS